MTFRYRIAAVFVFACGAATASLAQERFYGSFAEPADGGNLDVERSSFDGAVAYLVPRGHGSEALGAGPSAQRWRNMLFAIRGVQGRIVTFRLPARSETGARFHDVDENNVELIQPVWSYDNQARQWSPFEEVDAIRPVSLQDGLGTEGSPPAGALALDQTWLERDEYGWTFRNAVPFTEDVVYISINEHMPVVEFYEWLELNVLTHPWVKPTASQAVPDTCLIGYQSGGINVDGAFSREIPDMPLYAFQIADPAADPRKVIMLVSGQHPYEGQTKAALQAALEWILDPHDPAAAAYRAEYLTLVYPFVNPTGEVAGLWRGTAHEVHRDVNRNWDTPFTDPAADRGIDTVIIHKQAMLRDVAAIGLGQPYALVDLHQTFGDRMPALHYVMHDSNPLASAFVRNLQQDVEIAEVVSTPSQRTLRGFWQLAGAVMTLCVERAAFSTIADEQAFGRELMRAFAPGRAVSPVVAVHPNPVVNAEPAVAEAGPDEPDCGERHPGEPDGDTNFRRRVAAESSDKSG